MEFRCPFELCVIRNNGSINLWIAPDSHIVVWCVDNRAHERTALQNPIRICSANNGVFLFSAKHGESSRIIWIRESSVGYLCASCHVDDPTNVHYQRRPLCNNDLTAHREVSSDDQSCVNGYAGSANLNDIRLSRSAHIDAGD